MAKEVRALAALPQVQSSVFSTLLGLTNYEMVLRQGFSVAMEPVPELALWTMLALSSEIHLLLLELKMCTTTCP